MSDTNNYHSLSLLKTDCRNILQNMAHLLRQMSVFRCIVIYNDVSFAFFFVVFFCKNLSGVGAGDKTNRNKEFIGITFGKFDIVAQLNKLLWSN